MSAARKRPTLGMLRAAAPELYAALRALADAAEARIRGNGAVVEKLVEAIIVARAALAKAEGRA